MALSINPALNPSIVSRGLRSQRLRASASAVAAGPTSVVSRSASVPALVVGTHAVPGANARPPLSSVWREVQGANDWEDMVEPLSPLLCEEIVRYGEFVAACYKAFDLDQASRRYLNCKYGKGSMLREVGMGASGYEVTKYIYATRTSASPRRPARAAAAGSVTNTEWIANFMSSLTPARLDPHDPRPDVKVESGFLSLYTSDDSTCKFSGGSCREQLLSELARLIHKYKDEEISITLAGHSMGSSLALLLGYDLAELGLNRDGSNRDIPITVYSFGGPRVGNLGFKDRCEELGVKNFRLPWSCSCYTHVGVELALDFFKMKNPACVHDLDAYIGLLKSWPKMAKMKKEGADFNKHMRKLLRAEKLEAWLLLEASRQVGNLVQSLRI
uniref:Fungal lipase-type domain-containing protein n=1 Tax=Ananas comosus var. bracteatus TaxID=296719 RepID=A0A6V7NNP4_ANACO|nr:unnamed protein product [Ananas comosus var. bracteatus]